MASAFNAYCRTYQGAFKLGAAVLPWRMPTLIKGENSLKELPNIIKQQKVNSVLIVTDKTISSLGLMNGLLEGLNDAGITYVIYDKTVPNPTLDNIEEAATLYKENGCQGIVAFGGGSSMDCAKGVGARIANPNKPFSKMKGMLKIHKKTPPLFAIPTTAGTGSEATVAAVVTDAKTHDKYAVNALCLIPDFAVLDPVLTMNLPKHITSTTGMDALTHAVEAYIGRSNTKGTREAALKATKIIFEYLEEAYNNPTDLKARAEMQDAAFWAGVAFTRAYVGYIHALAHAVGGFYGIPHGLANAVIMPYVLERFGECAYKPLSEMAEAAGITKDGQSQKEKAEIFIQSIKDMNERMGIPNKLEGIKEEDVDVLADHAFRESNPHYPVPRIFDREELAAIYRDVAK